MFNAFGTSLHHCAPVLFVVVDKLKDRMSSRKKKSGKLQVEEVVAQVVVTY